MFVQELFSIQHSVFEITVNFKLFTCNLQAYLGGKNDISLQLFLFDEDIDYYL